MFHRIVRSTLLVLIQLYQASAFSGNPDAVTGPPARVTPTKRFLFTAREGGLILTVRRLAHCHPWGGSGYDPVPHIRKALT
jgi:putative component of membrane protein insertase Oxa1/YidC/SpoIIIJ protein YidD